MCGCSSKLKVRSALWPHPCQTFRADLGGLGVRVWAKTLSGCPEGVFRLEKSPDKALSGSIFLVRNQRLPDKPGHDRTTVCPEILSPTGGVSGHPDKGYPLRP